MTESENYLLFSFLQSSYGFCHFFRGKMKNISVFAHFDKENIIDDYVIYYLNELKKVSDKVIFVSDCDLPESELVKLNDVVDFTLAQHHGEYDFGSYKRGWQIALEKGLLNDAMTLTFANDSCYGPFRSLAPVYEEMNAKNCDFWGITCNENYLEGNFYPCDVSANRHVQSYFIVFKKQVFESDVFKQFIGSIKKETDKFKIIEKYEIGLTSLLCESGFKYACELDSDIGRCNYLDILPFHRDKTSIFMKKTILKTIYFVPFLSSFIDKIKSDYKTEFLIKNLKKIRCIREFQFKVIRKLLIRIHFAERKVFFLGKCFDIDKY